MPLYFLDGVTDLPYMEATNVHELIASLMNSPAGDFAYSMESEGSVFKLIRKNLKDPGAVDEGAYAAFDFDRDVISFDEIAEPLRDLFKDEVRAVGTLLGLPKELVYRQPFPGPGLAVRIIGDITKEKLLLLQEADAIFREEIAKAQLEHTPDQYFAVLTNAHSVGVMGDARTYGYVVALRAVETDDFMTAEFSRLPYEVLEKASSRITNEVRGISRVVYDISSKPPSTVEWE